ncbi:MFS transporter [Priestia aryabhattai]|uniref:MFS transporter n=1 Tax=Priestia aryabhattai TaxID=412384 RepID=UPI0028815CD1|nr:MFS transporter [Priestia aryabhattai]MDT0145597.1 MFS transporter [Priestia aryabhattai]MDT0151247.1 MFS transporter [Priestia aryabhattai]
MESKLNTSSVITEKIYPESAVVSTEKLSFSTKVSYGLGDFSSQLFWTFSGTYLTIFYTDVVGFTPAVVAMIMLFARILDGVKDPVIGMIADRTKSRHGRFRPYILYGTPLLALFSVLTFTVPSFGGNMEAKIAWAIITYIGLGVLYTVVNLPYGSLAAVMSKDPSERTALSSFRMFSSNLGTILLSTISMPLIIFFSSGTGEKVTARGYTMTAFILAAIAIPLFYLVFIKCKEVVQPVHTGKISIKQSISAIIMSKSLVCIFLILLLSLTAFFGRIGVQIYYYLYVIKRMDLISLLMPLPAIGAAIGIVLFTRLAKTFGKKKMLYFAYTGSAIALGFLYFIDYSNLPLLFIGTFVFGLMQYSTPIVIAMVPDAIDEIECQKGIRLDGTAYAATSISTKFASALGGAGTVALLGYFGYVANAEQTAEAIHGINIVVNIAPAVLYLLAIIPVMMYSLTDEKTKAIRDELDQKQVLK